MHTAHSKSDKTFLRYCGRKLGQICGKYSGFLLTLYTQGALWLKYEILPPKEKKFQVGFPSNLKQFSSIFLYNNLGSRPIWGLRPWQRAGSPPNVGWNLVLGDRRARGTLWINSASEHGCMHARVLNLGFGYGESFETIFRILRLT